MSSSKAYSRNSDDRKTFGFLPFFVLMLATGVPKLYAQERLEPIFPKENKALLFVEGEDAVSTNFAKEATLNYGCSGSRSLQLSRTVGLHGNAPFYADYVVLVREAGEYEFWYGGTPAGPEDDLLPSYTSPLVARIDEEKPFDVYRESINVVENYTPAYYWNRLKKTVNLAKGTHRIRFEVKEKRRFDGKYFFYLDSFFFRKTNDAERPEKPLAKFPVKPDYRGIDTPFSSIQDYENIIKAKPSAVDQYIYLSLVHSLIGDFQNSLKVLKRAAALQPAGGQILLLLAKNRIWKGDSAEGLAAYRQYLSAFPDDLDIWKEAGKVAAWIGKYPESISFYTDALGRFPEDAAILVNLGMTYLWKSEEKKADQYFATAFEKSSSSPEPLTVLASIYAVSGYPDKAQEVYRRGIELFPREISLRLRLAGILSGKGKNEEAEAVYGEIREKFTTSPELDEYLNLAKEEQSLKLKVIAGYRGELAANPDNLALREVLVQTYFWNGLREEAVQQHLAILSNHAYRAILEFDKENRELFAFSDRIAVYRNFFAEAVSKTAALRKETAEALSRYEDEKKAAGNFEEKIRSAAAKGEQVEPSPAGDPREVLKDGERKLAEAALRLGDFLERIEASVSRFKSDTADFQGLAEKQKAAEEQFARLASPLAWKWDKNFYRTELDRTAKTEPVLSSYALGRINQIDRSLREAKRRFEESSKGDRIPPAVRYGSWELALWDANEEDRKSASGTWAAEIQGYAPFAKTVEELQSSLLKEKGKTALFTQETISSIRADLAALEKTRAEAQTLYGEAEKLFSDANAILKKRLEAKFFDLQEKTLLLRYDLGDYYLAEGKEDEATKQFRHVLEMEPANLSALYKLGITRQRYGDWHEAMDYYKKVYRIDPRYENVEGYHNLLAKSHPDQVGFEVKSFGDTSRVVTTAEGYYLHSFASDLALDARVATENLRMYQDGYGDEASSHQLHTLSAALPYTLSGSGLTLTPKAGFSLASGVYDNPGGYTESSIPSPLWYLGRYKIAPDVGLSASASLGGFPLSGGYSFARERDTFIPGRDAVYRHTGEATFVAPFRFDNRFGLSSISLRTYGKASYLDDGNVKGMLVEDGTFLFHVKDEPWTTLGFSAVLAFEHSLKPAKDDIYYSPEGVVLAKAGPLGSAWIPLEEGRVLGVILQVLPGAYSEKVNTSAKTSFYLESSLRLELVLGESSFYFTAYESGTYGAADDYWAVQFALGYSHKIMSLLAQ